VQSPVVLTVVSVSLSATKQFENANRHDSSIGGDVIVASPTPAPFFVYQAHSDAFWLVFSCPPKVNCHKAN